MPAARELRISENGVVSYPIEPFARWLDKLVAEAKAEFPYRPTFGNQRKKEKDIALPPVKRVAARCGVLPDTLEKWRDRKVKWIDERVVDAVVSLEGSIHIADLYPLYRTRPVAKGRPGRAPRMRTSVKPPTERSIPRDFRQAVREAQHAASARAVR